MTQAAECASLLVCMQHPFAEQLLVEPLANSPGHVLAARLVRAVGDLVGRDRVSSRDVVHLDREPQGGRVVADNERRVAGDICPGSVRGNRRVGRVRQAVRRPTLSL